MNMLHTIANRGRKLLGAAVALTAISVMALTGTGSASADIGSLAKPDLQIQTASWECTPGVPYCNAVRLHVTIKNGGLANAAGSHVRFTDQSNNFKGVAYVAPLAAGQSVTVYHDLPTFSCGGAHTRVVKLDSYNVVQELNENNNTAMRTYVYPAC